MAAVTWFAHRCWFCGHKSREVDLIVGDGNHQCVWENREACQKRRWEKYPWEPIGRRWEPPAAQEGER